MTCNILQSVKVTNYLNPEKIKPVNLYKSCAIQSDFKYTCNKKSSPIFIPNIKYPIFERQQKFKCSNNKMLILGL